MRSLLLVPANEQRLAEAVESGADAIIIDLACAPPAERIGVRAVAARFLKGRRSGDGLARMVRINALDSGEADSDLDAVMVGAPEAILLPRSVGAPSVQQLSAKLAVREAHLGLADGATRIIAVADSAEALFHMGSYRGSSPRLSGLVWSAEALRAEIGAETNRDQLGNYLGAYQRARELTLLAAASAGVAAIDGVFPDVGDFEGLRGEALAARRDGFAGKVAIGAVQVAIINETFRPLTAPTAQNSM